jgi:hypothetical protein
MESQTGATEPPRRPHPRRETAMDTLAYLRAVHDNDFDGACALYAVQDQPEMIAFQLASLLSGAIAASGQADATWEHLYAQASQIPD